MAPVSVGVYEVVTYTYKDIILRTSITSQLDMLEFGSLRRGGCE
jgi:hypothetical protein